MSGRPPSLSRKNSFTLPDVPASEYYRIYQESKSASSSRKNSFNSKTSCGGSATSLRHDSVVAALNQHNVYTTTSEDEHVSMENKRPEIKVSGGKIADRYDNWERAINTMAFTARQGC